MTFSLISILLILILIILVHFAGKSKYFKVVYIKKLLLPVLCVIFILSLIIFSKTAVNSAANGIKLWLNIVFPSLFPFFVASQVLNKTGFVKATGTLLEPIMRPLFNVPGCGSFALAMGISSGYPVGAKITTEMRNENLLSKLESERLLTFTNNSGPLFIFGAVSVGMFGNPDLGLFLFACHIAACVTVGILFRFYGKKEKQSGGRYDKHLIRKFKNEVKTALGVSTSNIGTIFGDAIKESLLTMLNIGGFIIFFSVIINLLLETGFINRVSDVLSLITRPVGITNDIIPAILSGFFEITTGANMVSKADKAALVQQLPAASFIIGWAGLSVHSQVLSIISKTDISIKPYLLGKFLQGIFAAIYSGIGIMFSLHEYKTVTVFFQHQTERIVKWYDYLLMSCQNLIASLIIIIICISLTLIIKQVSKPYRHRSL